jgi:RimJ/RimL family protein N-acetyltransferase
MPMPELSNNEGLSEIVVDDASTAPAMPRYPIELALDVTTREGTVLHLRPIRPNDAPRLVEFHENLSVQSVYRRFLFTHPKLPPAEVERFTCVDYINRLAIVAEDHDRLVAVARYDRIGDTSEAEVAFVVADQYQHHGIATMLLEELADAAWRNGISSFTALTLAENREMIGVFMNSGYQVSKHFEDGTFGVHFSITPDDASRTARSVRRSGTEYRPNNPSETPPC